MEQFHPCHGELMSILNKFQGLGNLQNSNDHKVIFDKVASRNDSQDIRELQEQVRMIQDGESQSNKSVSGDLHNKQNDFQNADSTNDLALAINLFKYLKGKSFIDKKHCLNEHCAKQFHCQTINYFSENKLVL
jgi:hypothetical protein